LFEREGRLTCLTGQGGAATLATHRLAGLHRHVDSRRCRGGEPPSGLECCACNALQCAAVEQLALLAPDTAGSTDTLVALCRFPHSTRA
jgi:hypothetical protein